MKKNTHQIARTHDSRVLDEFLSLGTQEELARTESRMMLAAKIFDAMEAMGLSKKQFADLMGKSPSVITKWLSGGHNFTADTLTDIQRVLNVRLLALDEKPVVQKVYYVTINVISTISREIPHPSLGRPYSVPSSYGGGYVIKPEGNFERTLALA